MSKRNRIITQIKRIAFANFLDSCLTIIILFLITLFATLIFKWIIFDADWSVVTNNLPLYAFGMFPEDQRWRPALWLILISLLTILTLFGPRWPLLRKALPISWILIIPVGVSLLAGGVGLLPIASRHWGGLTLTIILMSCSAVIAFPMGILLALGRQSNLILIKYLSSIYIDAMRAIPLIAILFFGQLLIPLFLPLGIEVNRVLRAICAFALFVSAYIAEDIRGGLQSIPKTQTEAAKALGLNKFQITKFIILPQALTIAIPALTNQAVGLLQNTSLMSILGLVELLGVSRSLLANPEFIGLYIEVYVWIAGIYWIICTLMALLARHIEKKLTVRESAL